MEDKDYKPRTFIHFLKQGETMESTVRISQEITGREADALGKLWEILADNKRNGALYIGEVRIWMTGALEYIGPPGRNPELKYSNPTP